MSRNKYLNTKFTFPDDQRGCMDCLEKYRGADNNLRCRIGGFRIQLTKNAIYHCTNFKDEKDGA